jgi:hypothetical protein
MSTTSKPYKYEEEVACSKSVPNSDFVLAAFPASLRRTTKAFDVIRHVLDIITTFVRHTLRHSKLYCVHCWPSPKIVYTRLANGIGREHTGEN